MFVGHAFLALALGLFLGQIAGLRSSRLLALGLVAAGASIVPDLDLVVTVGSIAGVFGDSLVGSWEGYWGASNPLHRDVSHTLIGGFGAAIVVGGAAIGTRSFFNQRVGPLFGAVGIGVVGLFLPLLVLGSAVETVGWVGYSVVLLGAVLLGALAATKTTLGPGPVFAGAALGLLLHPFTDVFLGTPPRMFYPLEPGLFAESVVFTADSTLNLLGIALAELAAIWVGVIALSRVHGRRIGEVVDRWAAIGLVYPLVMLFVPQPTMADAHWLGFTLVPFGIVGLAPLLESGRTDPDWLLRSVATGLATLTVAAVAYGVSLAIRGIA
ncbi:MAG: metal-dependent hydrolase [Halodesulfurarchaeum sp.]|nr:metal-dependent hydrolase [Halodesulfurarchaeum sp.]